jgi:hypothetical protein
LLWGQLSSTRHCDGELQAKAFHNETTSCSTICRYIRMSRREVHPNMSGRK